MKTRFTVFLLCCVLLYAIAAPALANPSPTAEDLVAPRAYLSDEAISFPEELQPLNALNGPAGYTTAAYATALGYDTLAPTSGADLYLVCHRGEAQIHVLVRHGQLEIFYASVHDNVTKVTLAYTDADAAKILFYLASQPVIDATELEKTALGFLPLSSLYMVEVFATDFVVDSDGHLTEDNLTFTNYMAEPRFFNPH